MRFCVYSCILLVTAVVGIFCDVDSAAYGEGTQSTRSDVRGVNLRRRTRSPILRLGLGIGGGRGITTTQTTPMNNRFGSPQNLGGYNIGSNTYGTMGGIDLGLGGFLSGIGGSHLLGTPQRRPTQGGSTSPSNPGYGTGNYYQGGTTGQTYPSGGNGVGTSGPSNFQGVEVGPVVGTTVEPYSANTNGCVLPAQPTGGNYELGPCSRSCNNRPGSVVPVGSFLTYTCDEKYTLKGNNVTFCHNNTWYMSPTCAKTCKALKSNSVDIVCKHQGKTVSCESDIKPGTTATMACKHSFKIPLANDPVYRELTCLDDGVWDRPLIHCIPECGTPIAQGNTLIVSGFTAELGVFPWHVGIYEKNSSGFYMQICGGSLISPSLVISAAHCFYDDVTGQLKHPSQYAVAAGKHYRLYNWPEKYVQKSGISMIEIPDRYYGATGNFAQDIALLSLLNPFTLSTLVRPICMDWDNLHERDHLQIGKMGKAVGWGKTAEGVPSTELQEINLPYIPFSDCMSTVPSEFRGYITSDKFCAGYLNGSSLCEGDSGGGLAFELSGLWYLRGIVSVSPVAENTCDNNYYTAFTNVGNFREWIRARFLGDK